MEFFFHQKMPVYLILNFEFITDQQHTVLLNLQTAFEDPLQVHVVVLKLS